MRGLRFILLIGLVAVVGCGSEFDWVSLNALTRVWPNLRTRIGAMGNLDGLQKSVVRTQRGVHYVNAWGWDNEPGSRLTPNESAVFADGVRGITPLPSAWQRSMHEMPARNWAQGQDQNATIKEKTNLVTLTVSVTDKQNGFVAGLKPEEFYVYDNGIKQKISFFSDEDIALSIGILLDTSGSLDKYFSQSLEAVKEFIQTSHPDDDFCFLTFSKSIKTQAEFADGNTVISKLRLPEPEGNTALYDAVYYGLEKVRQGRHDKRALLLVSDGQENSSRYSNSELMKLIREADVQIYCIGIGTQYASFDTGKELLQELAVRSGGRAFFPGNAKKLEDAISRIALLLRHQYSIGFYPSNARQDNSWHKLKVKLGTAGMPQKLRISAKEGYYTLP